MITLEEFRKTTKIEEQFKRKEPKLLNIVNNLKIIRKSITNISLEGISKSTECVVCPYKNYYSQVFKVNGLPRQNDFINRSINI